MDIYIPTKNFSDIKQAMTKAISILGKPETLFSDREKAWVGPQWESFIKQKGVVHLYAYGGHASMSERAVRTVKERLERLRGQGGTTRDILEIFRSRQGRCLCVFRSRFLSRGFR